jgi:hypothetical protein
MTSKLNSLSNVDRITRKKQYGLKPSTEYAADIIRPPHYAFTVRARFETTQMTCHDKANSFSRCSVYTSKHLPPPTFEHH